jgi:NADH-quinone oxidoreductase subunit L
LNVVAIVGLATAFVAATIGLAQNDIKKVFAYSTVSQLGYMFLALGAGAFSAGIYHLMTHAFFKALLFLGAGSVIHAVGGSQDMREMGGLRKKIPITFWVLMCAGIAIAGVPFTSGYFSKEEILTAAYHHAPWMYWVGTFTALMTAFYVFRALFLTFFGEYRGKAHVHEAPPVMWIPLAILAVLSLFGGFIKIPHFLEPIFKLEEGPEVSWLTPVAISAGLGGIALAYFLYGRGNNVPVPETAKLSPLHNLVYHKYYVDEIYASTVVHPLVDGSRSLLWRVADAGIIDGTVNGVGKTARAIGGILKFAQSGNIRSYAGWVVAGTVLVIAVIGLMGGSK